MSKGAEEVTLTWVESQLEDALSGPNTAKNVYDTRQKLYEIEEILADKAFLRISKSVVVNLMKIKALKPAMNGRFSAVLSNGEEVIISRKYVPSLKEKIRGGNLE